MSREKKTWLKWMAALAVLLLILGAGLWRWYARPMTLEELSPQLDWDTIYAVSGSYVPADPESEAIQMPLSPISDPATQELVALLRETAASRGIYGDGSHPISEGSPILVSLWLKGENGFLDLTQSEDALTIRYNVYNEGPGKAVRCVLPEGKELWEVTTEYIDEHYEP